MSPHFFVIAFSVIAALAVALAIVMETEFHMEGRARRDKIE